MRKVTGMVERPRFIMVRHGESLANIDPSVYTIMPDHKIPLTELGKEQARQAGHVLATLVSKEDFTSTCIWKSPYKRAEDTCAEAFKGLVPSEEALKMSLRMPIKHDPRLREQEFGAYRDLSADERETRQKYGHFFWRPANGESAADVYDRVSTWLESAFRDTKYTTHVVFTHGLTMRVIAMRLLHAPYEEFERWENPENCGIVVLQPSSSGYMFHPDYLIKRWRQ